MHWKEERVRQHRLEMGVQDNSWELIFMLLFFPLLALVVGGKALCILVSGFVMGLGIYPSYHIYLKD